MMKHLNHLLKNYLTKTLNQNKMRITIEQYEHKIIHEVPHNDVTLEEALEMIEGLLKATGYSFKGNLEIVDEWHENDEIQTNNEAN